MKFKKIKKVLIIFVAVIFVVTGSRIIVNALIDETNSVKVDAETIENSTLIIGTHLIHISAMSDSLYSVAQQSADESGQYNMYYKSELADGTWYDITNAFSLEDITTGGVPVEAKVIEALNMTHHTKSDGITYDLVAEESVPICDVYSPYNLEGLQELNPLLVQYKNLEENEDKSETDERNLQYIRDFYVLEFSDKNTEECDVDLNALHKYFQILSKDGAEPAICNMVQSVMDKIDAQRRAQVFANMQEEALDNLIKAISRNKKYNEADILNSNTNGTIEDSTEETTVSEEETEAPKEQIDGFIVDDNLLTALSEAVANVEESYNAYTIKMLDSGTTTLSKTEYNEIISLVEFAKENNWAKCDEQIEKLIIIESLNTGTIKQPIKEVEFIDNVLLKEAEKAYYAAISEGAGEEYKSLPVNSANATKQNVLKNQQTELEKIRTEYQFIIQAKLSRIDIEKGIEYINELIKGSNKYYIGIEDDEFSTFAASSADSYVQWLNERLSSLQNSLGSGEMDSLLAEKEKLKQEKMEALDDNDLAAAKEIDAKIELVDKKISDLEKNLNKIINSSTATEAEKAAAKAALGSGSVTAAIQSMVNELIEDIKSGTMDGVENRLNAICDFADTNPQTVMNALTDVYKELGNQKIMNAGNADTIDKLMNATENIVTEKIDAYTAELKESDISTLLSSYFNLDSDENFELDDLLGGNSDAINENDKGISLAALAMYYEDTKSDNAKELLNKYATINAKEGNSYVYSIYEDDMINEYITVDKLASIKGYRYIFDGSQKEATLQDGSNYYKFSAFSDVVRRPEDKQDKMKYPAGYQGTIFIHESYASEEFDVETIYLSESGYAVMLDSEDVNSAGELYDILVEIGGQE